MGVFRPPVRGSPTLGRLYDRPQELPAFTRLPSERLPLRPKTASAFPQPPGHPWPQVRGVRAADANFQPGRPGPAVARYPISPPARLLRSPPAARPLKTDAVRPHTPPAPHKPTTSQPACLLTLSRSSSEIACAPTRSPKIRLTPAPTLPYTRRYRRKGSCRWGQPRSVRRPR